MTGWFAIAPAIACSLRLEAMALRHMGARARFVLGKGDDRHARGALSEETLAPR
jgi:hypothetical protein